jgi:CheY-like chemotaxis protein
MTVETRRYRVVVVDDYPETARITCMLLDLLGYECWAGSTGQEALALVEHHAPDLVILDVGLPDISGYEVARRLRDSHGSAIYLIAMTGWGQPDDRGRAIEAGFDWFLLKPVDGAAIADVLERFTARRESSRARP